VFFRNCWYMAGWSHELDGGQLLARTLLEQPVLLYRGESGAAIALDNRCAHRGALLSNGRREGDCVRCMYHGLKFDANGRCVQIPGQEVIPAKLAVRRYPIVERQGLLWIWMGEAERADPAEILDFPYLSNSRWRGVPDYLHYEANWLLIVDNLADFAHLAFVHTKTLGGSEEYAFKSKPTSIDRLPRGFRVVRWHLNADPPPFHRKVIPNPNDKVDRRNIGHMEVPGVFMLESLFAPAGKGAQHGPVEGAREYRNCQFMTPETRRTTHFFWNYLNDFEGDQSWISESLHQSLIEGFLEDKSIIEGQQRVLDADPSFEFHPIVADAPLAHFRRTLGKLIEAERTTLRAA
jgi:vanillate O-demethylase monooxygenase subunit